VALRRDRFRLGPPERQPWTGRRPASGPRWPGAARPGRAGRAAPTSVAEAGREAGGDRPADRRGISRR